MKTNQFRAGLHVLQRAGHILETVIPGVNVARTYQLRWLRPDIIAGITIFAMLVPQGMAMGELAGLTPVVGLHAAIGAMLGYAIFGGSRTIIMDQRQLPPSWWLPSWRQSQQGAARSATRPWQRCWLCWWEGWL